MCRWLDSAPELQITFCGELPCDAIHAVEAALKRQKGGLRVAGDRIAQGQGPVCGELGQKPVGKRLDSFVFLDATRRWIGGGYRVFLRYSLRRGACLISIVLVFSGKRDRRLILRTDIAALGA